MSDFEIRPRCLIRLRGSRSVGRTMYPFRESPHRAELSGPELGARPMQSPTHSPPRVPDSPETRATASSLESHAANATPPGAGRGPPNVPRSTLPREFYRGRARAQRAAIVAAVLV